ncbi:MAG: Protein translocase subunit SecE [candidate division WS2 bacterium]|uniref:Protein translocase subunit SecE n=1 Tax=Psychracetigena formicireducens TaxID=2986056 RepID=A0A9E2BI67_PSYF1|nr:Protein translocase subunit SecE [Candidatus Psychracetigena formicireducens]MBT9145327.1 Protein translocase subunit SecE [Candidatus Psychracetigena formicireducens]MBT9150195.1 Protein translocase subunit SecE [Candidatus Psychracetigena formicireducens]
MAKKKNVFLNFINSGKQYLLDVRSELKKVMWPTKQQVIISTQIVLIFTFFFSMYVGLWDGGLAFLLSRIYAGIAR